MRARLKPIALLALVLVFGALQVMTERTRRTIDLTEERSLSLTEETERVVDQLPGPVRVTAFLAPEDPDRVSAAALLQRYRRLDRRIRFRVLDPSRAQGEVRRLEVDPLLDPVVVEHGQSRELAATVTEQDVTGALLRVVRSGEQRTVCFATGHGEPSVTDDGSDGLAVAAAIARRHGYVVEEIDLLARPEVPAPCDVVVLANPQTDLGPAADAVGGWVAGGRSLLLLTDPVSSVDLNPLVGPYSLVIRRGLVLEGDRESVLPDDPVAPIVRRYRSANPIVRRLPPTFFPAVQAAEAVGQGRPQEGLTSSSLATTSEQSYLERDPTSGTFDPDVDRPGPVSVVAAADRSIQEDGVVRRARVVLTGDVDFATNGAVQQAGNSVLFVRSLDWLTQEQDLLVLSANLPKDRTLALTAGRLTYARFVALVLVPGVFLLLGIGVWLVRRSR